MFPQPAYYLLANSCLNTTQAPIKVPKTKNYNSRHKDAQHYFEKLFVKLLIWIWRVKLYQWYMTCKTQIMTKRHYISCTPWQWVCLCVRVCVRPYVYTLVTSADACARAQHVCACSCVISVFRESQGPCFLCGALVLALWGGCRSCHYNWCGESSESCYLKAHQH